MPTWPITASGTLSSLYRVLCTIRSCYCFAISLVPIFSLTTSIRRMIELHSQATRHGSAPTSKIQIEIRAHLRDCNPEICAIPDNLPCGFQRYHASMPRTLQFGHEHSHKDHATQANSEWAGRTTSLAVTEIIAVASSSSAD